MLALTESRTLPAPMLLVMRRGPPSSVILKMRICLAPECIKNRKLMMARLTPLVASNKKNTTKIPAQDNTMLSMKQLRIQLGPMPLVLRRGTLNLAAKVILACPAQDSTKKPTQMMVNHLKLVEKLMKNTTKIPVQELMMLSMKRLRIQREHMLLAQKKEIHSLVMFKTKIFQDQECTMNKTQTTKRHSQ